MGGASVTPSPRGPVTVTSRFTIHSPPLTSDDQFSRRDTVHATRQPWRADFAFVVKLTHDEYSEAAAPSFPWQRCDTLRTSGFEDNVKFSHNGPYDASCLFPSHERMT